MSQTSGQQWLWDLYPLAEDAWPNTSLSRDYWSDWLKEEGQTVILRRWVPGPNGPSFLTEYTPADDYITEGHRGRHDTFNGLYRDADREFYVPRPEDLRILKRFDPNTHPEMPNWTSIRVALCRAGHDDAGLARTKSPVLIVLLNNLIDSDIPRKHGQEISDTLDLEVDQIPQAAPAEVLAQNALCEVKSNKPTDQPQENDADEEQFGGPQEDLYDRRVVNWFGKRLYLGPEGSQVRELFMLLAQKPGVPHNLSEVQRAVDGMETYREEHGEDAFQKAMNRIAKALSKLRKHLRENDLDDHVVLLKEGSRDYPNYTLMLRFGHS